MGSFAQAMEEYQRQLEKGEIQRAYQGLMKYVRDLKTHFGHTYPDYAGSGSIYYGYMDMTYFALFPESLKRRKLKIAIVFVHDKFRFEVWLSGSNRDAQAEYWRLFKEGDWDMYHLAADPRKADFLMSHVLDESPAFGDLDALTTRIERGTLVFIKDVERFLSVRGI